MRAAMILVALALAGCDRREAEWQRQVKELEQQLAIVERAGDKAQACRIAGEIADVHLKRRDESAYQLADVQRGTRCLDAQLETMN